MPAICRGPLRPTISTLRTWLWARASRDLWVMSVFCRAHGTTTVKGLEIRWLIVLDQFGPIRAILPLLDLEIHLTSQSEVQGVLMDL